MWEYVVGQVYLITTVKSVDLSSMKIPFVCQLCCDHLSAPLVLSNSRITASSDSTDLLVKLLSLFSNPRVF